MDRTLYLSVDAADALARCVKEKVGVSALERLPGGGVRLVCMSGEGAETMRAAFKSKVMREPVPRDRIRPRGPER